MPTHDDLLLEGHDAGLDGDGLCPSCQEPINPDGERQCICCPICQGDGQIGNPQKGLSVCPACEGLGVLRPRDEREGNA
jgi:hypothetical protein